MAATVSCAMAMGRIGQSKPGWGLSGSRRARVRGRAAWAARTKSLCALCPVLYLRGVSTGDFQEALAALLGKDAPNMSPAVISRLTAEWPGGVDTRQEGGPPA